MAHLFGELLTLYRTRKHGLSQAKLAQIVGYDPAIIARMCQGTRDLTGPSGRERVVRIIAALHGEGVLRSLDEANALLAAADMPPLYDGLTVEATLIHKLRQRTESSPEYSALGAPSHTTHHTNLPVPLTSFIGREKEMAELTSRLKTSRLLTLIGAGGCGKSRLALEVATQMQSKFADGAWLVELAAIADSPRVADTAAMALGLRPVDRPANAILMDHLREKHLLLVLDNCEHLITACAELAAMLLRVCPRLHILATSREPLHIPGEMVWRVPSLSLPDLLLIESRGLSAIRVDHLLGYEAIQLFVERADAVCASHGSILTPDNASFIAQICIRLDGMPLAIELAAARTTTLSVAEILTLLDDRFNLLTTGSRIALPQHKTLRAAMDWSYDLLTESERVLFRRLAVFAGGWTLQAAEAVCASADEVASTTFRTNAIHTSSPIQSGTELHPAEVLDVLSGLVDKSLAHLMADDRSSETRYNMLETIRQYALERLIHCGEVEELRRRHASYFLLMAETAEPYLFAHQQIQWFKRLERELDNIRAMLAWALTHSEIEMALRMAGAVRRYWQTRGRVSEGREWLEKALSADAEIQPSIRMKALYSMAVLAHCQGDDVLSRAVHEQALELIYQTDDKWLIGEVLAGPVYRSMTEHEYQRAKTNVEQALTIAHTIGNEWVRADALNKLGLVELDHGNAERAGQLFRECVTALMEVGDRSYAAVALMGAGHIALFSGSYAQAHLDYKASLRLIMELGFEYAEHTTIWYCLRGMAELAARNGDPLRMARLLGVIEIESETQGGMPHTWFPKLNMDGAVERCRALSGADFDTQAYAMAWAEGRAMPLKQAVEYALMDSR